MEETTALPPATPVGAPAPGASAPADSRPAWNPLPPLPLAACCRRLVKGLDLLARAALLLLGFQIWLVQGYRVQGNCMEPTLCHEERLLGSPVALSGGVRRGDVVVFRPPHRRDAVFVKRVIGLPGDVVAIRAGRVYLNGLPLPEPYLRRPWRDERPAVAVPAGMAFVLGDNRDFSNDSRQWGLLPLANIQSKAWLRYWPPERFGPIR